MIDIKFEIDVDSSPTSGLSMGHLEIECNKVKITSKTRDNKFMMMLMPSIICLIDGLIVFLGSKKKTYEFYAVDSSFKITFKKESQETLFIEFKDDLIQVSIEQFIQALYSSSLSVWEENKRELHENDIIIDDYTDSLSELFKLVNQQN